jgi:hypothetical protein
MSFRRTFKAMSSGWSGVKQWLVILERLERTQVNGCYRLVVNLVVKEAIHDIQIAIIIEIT